MLALAIVMLAAAVLLASLALWRNAPARRVADRQEVEALMYRYALGVDSLDREVLAGVFAPDAVAEYKAVEPSPFELDEHLEGFDNIFAWLESVLAERGDARPTHFITNPLIELDGDRARLQVYMHNRGMTGGGVYRIDAARTPDGWRIQKLHLDEQTFDPERQPVSSNVRRKSLPGGDGP